MSKFLFILPLALLIGCASNPNVSPQTQKIVRAQDSYSFVVAGCTTLRVLNKISKSDAQKIEAVRNVAANKIDAYKVNGTVDWRPTYLEFLQLAVSFGMRSARAQPDDDRAIGDSNRFRAEVEQAWREVQ